jgi:hypothetical protein
MKSEKTEEVTMMLNDIQRSLPPIGLWTQDPLPAADHRSKDILGQIADDEAKLSHWQFIFLQSRANGCFYNVEELPHTKWQWPKNTWFQDRLSQKLTDGEFATLRLSN